MKKKYLNKESVTYQFKWEVLTLPGNSDLSLEGKKKLWEIFLYHMGINKLISKRSASTWIYPEKVLRVKKK
jgi:hypothetical protein